MDAYFDTNIYSHIFTRHKITDADVEKLEQAVASGALRVFTSFPVIEETNAARLKALDAANGRLELIRTLTVQDQIVKHHGDIIDADIHAYAHGEVSPGKLQAPYPGLKEVFWDHTENNYKKLNEYAQETIDRVAAFAKDMEDSFKTLIRPLVDDSRKKREGQQPFPDYWNAMAEPWVELLADKYGVLEECKAKGIKGLLDVHSIRLNTISQISLTYANTYERGKFDRGDSRDMQHVVCASAVPIFVTHDKALHRVLARMPIPDLDVIDLPTLLTRL